MNRETPREAHAVEAIRRADAAGSAARRVPAFADAVYHSPMPEVELLFLGTGTSAGVPMIGCHCPVCTSTDPHDKRTRPSVVISSAAIRVLVDTTPELRLQCVANGVDSIDAVVFTHAHADHIMGLDDVRRFNAIRNGPLDVWADAKTHAALTRCFAYAFTRARRPTRGSSARTCVRSMIGGPFDIGGDAVDARAAVPRRRCRCSASASAGWPIAPT